MKTFVLVNIFFVLMSLNGFGQNYLLDSSQNAYFVNGTVGQLDHQFYKKMLVGYSINGRLDIAISGSHKNEGSGYASSYTISPSFAYLLIKQGKLPFSLGTIAEYEYKAFPATNVIKHNTIRFGIPLYYQARINKNLSLIPGIYGKINLAKYSLYDDRFDYKYEENNKSYTLGIQNTILLNRFSLTPGLSYTKGRGCSITIQLGLILFKRSYIKSLDY